MWSGFFIQGKSASGGGSSDTPVVEISGDEVLIQNPDSLMLDFYIDGSKSVFVGGGNLNSMLIIEEDRVYARRVN